MDKLDLIYDLVNKVLADGYHNGTQNGEYELAEKILRILHGETDVK